MYIHDCKPIIPLYGIANMCNVYTVIYVATCCFLYISDITATGAVHEIINIDHCYYWNVTTSSSDVILNLLQPHPPMSSEAIQQLIDST